MRASLVAQALDDIFAARGLGLCLVDDAGRVAAREGALAAWAPEPGADFFAHPLMLGFRDAAFALRASGGRLDLPALGFVHDGATLRLDLALFWGREARHLVVLCTAAAERHAIDVALAQSRREQRILEERLRAQARQLAESRRLMALFIERMPAAVAMIDADQCFIFASRRWRADLRQGDAPLEGRAFAECLPLLARRWARPLQAALAGTNVATTTGRVRHADGALDWMSWAMIPWRDDEGRVGGALILCERVTEAHEQRRALARQSAWLREANLDLQRFSVAMSHDLQAPVRQIAMFARLLDADCRDLLPEKGRDFLDEIAAAAERMRAMIQALLRYMRIAAHERTLPTVDLAAAVEAARRNLAVDLAAARARLDVGPLPSIDGDAELLTALFQNLIENALKYRGDAPPVITVSALPGPAPGVAFCDNGPGIPAADREGAFMLFKRLSRDSHRAGQGAGLAICRRIVEVHGGTIEIDPHVTQGLRLVIGFPPRARKPAGRARG